MIDMPYPIFVRHLERHDYRTHHIPLFLFSDEAIHSAGQGIGLISLFYEQEYVAPIQHYRVFDRASWLCLISVFAPDWDRCGIYMSFPSVYPIP
jgi:hypothetical protein